MRLGAGAGAVVFFSAQQAARARAYADLTRFHEVLYAHLDLVEADRLRSALSDLLEEHLEIEQRRADEVQAAEDKLREKLMQGEARLEEVLRNAPWDLDEPPTRLLSEQRVRSFVAEVARELGTRARSTWECLTALDHAEKWVLERSDSRREALTRSSASAREKHLSLSAQIVAIRELRERENR